MEFWIAFIFKLFLTHISMVKNYLIIFHNFRYKFLLIWRIPRAQALLDGIEVTENMPRCMCNHYNFQGFWRSWHCAFKYMYIPLGGRNTKYFNIWVIFTWVALWHDFQLNLVIWAWLICLFLIPEIALQQFITNERFRLLWKKVWWKYICALFGALDISLMIIANLIGFGIGFESLMELTAKFSNFQGLIAYFGGLFWLFVGTLLMFWKREVENQKVKYQ